MPAHYITLANGRQVPTGNYVQTLKSVFVADPSTVYPYGLTSWWGTSGWEIRRQFRQSIHARINSRAGQDWRNGETEKEADERRDCADIRAHVTSRVILRSLRCAHLRRRFAHMLYTEEY